jgi:hypothetical protein
MLKADYSERSFARLKPGLRMTERIQSNVKCSRVSRNPSRLFYVWMDPVEPFDDSSKAFVLPANGPAGS